MKSLAIAAGELTQRLREPSFVILLVALAAGTTLLVPGPHEHYGTLTIGGNHIYGGSSFAGTSAGLDFGVFAGFFCIFALGTGLHATTVRNSANCCAHNRSARSASSSGASWRRGDWARRSLFGAMLLLGDDARLPRRRGLPTTALRAELPITRAPNDVVRREPRGGARRAAGQMAGPLDRRGAHRLSCALRSRARRATGRPRYGCVRFRRRCRRRGRNSSRPSGPGRNSPSASRPEDLRRQSRSFGRDSYRTRTPSCSAGGRCDRGAPDLARYRRIYRRRAGISLRGAKPSSPRATTRALTTALLERRRAPAVARRTGRKRTLFSRAQKSAARLCDRGPLRLCMAGRPGGAPLDRRPRPAAAARLESRVRRRATAALARRNPRRVTGRPRRRFRREGARARRPVRGPGRGTVARPVRRPGLWLVATAGVLLEIAWLATIAWALRAELLALGVAALWWYLVTFNEVPPPVDYAGLWSAPMQTVIVDAVIAVALIATSSVLLRRRSL